VGREGGREGGKARTLQVPTPIAPSVVIIVRETMPGSEGREGGMEGGRERARTLQVPTPMAPKVIIIVRETMSSSPLLKAKMEPSLESCGKERGEGGREGGRRYVSSLAWSGLVPPVPPSLPPSLLTFSTSSVSCTTVSFA
jgi:hypothetical protein